MSIKNLVKRNQSSMQVLKTLKVLLEDNYSMENLLDILNAEESDFNYNNSIVSKYINTCRYCGFDIPKVNNKYIVASMPFGLEFSQKDLNVIKELHLAIQEFMACKYNTIFNKFLDKLSKYSNKTLWRMEKKTTKVVFECFEKAIEDKRKIKLILKNKKTYECIPIKLIEEKKSSYFLVEIDGKEKLISINSVAAIQSSDIRYIKKFYNQSVLFRLKGGLAKRYTPRECESVMQEPDGSLIVTNRGECKEILLSRLLRYDTCCEIISPKEYRKDMLEILNATLKNYGV